MFDMSSSPGAAGDEFDEPKRPMRKREKRASYGRFGVADVTPSTSQPTSTCSSTNHAVEDPLRQARWQCASLSRAVDKSNHLNMLISQCVDLRRMRASTEEWSPLINDIERKLASLQARLDAIEFDPQTRPHNFDLYNR